MSKNEIKKQKKREAILKSAYHLFTTIGFSGTTILAIAVLAGVGKGTFYLYFDSKEQVRDELIMIKSSQLLNEAVTAMREEVRRSKVRMTVSDRLIFVMDYILDLVSEDHELLTFIAKNLSWGLLFESSIQPNEDEGVIDFKSFVMESFEQDGIELRDPMLLFYTLIELVSSTCYNIILNNDPVSLEEYRPYLHRAIRLLVDDAVIKDVQ